jgi:hypothetical protein
MHQKSTDRSIGDSSMIKLNKVSKLVTVSQEEMKNEKHTLVVPFSAFNHLNLLPIDIGLSFDDKFFDVFCHTA